MISKVKLKSVKEKDEFSDSNVGGIANVLTNCTAVLTTVV